MLMNSIKVTYELPADLVERAKTLGIDVEAEAEFIIEALRERILKERATQRFTEIADKLSSLPDELKPTPEEIAAEIRAYRQEQRQQEQK